MRRLIRLSVKLPHEELACPKETHAPPEVTLQFNDSILTITKTYNNQ